MDPEPGGPKTCGSCGSGSGSPTLTGSKESVTRVGVVQPGGEEGGVHGLRHQVVPVQQILPVQGGRQLQVILRTKIRWFVRLRNNELYRIMYTLRI